MKILPFAPRRNTLYLILKQPPLWYRCARTNLRSRFATPRYAFPRRCQVGFGISHASLTINPLARSRPCGVHGRQSRAPHIQDVARLDTPVDIAENWHPMHGVQIHGLPDTALPRPSQDVTRSSKQLRHIMLYRSGERQKLVAD